MAIVEILEALSTTEAIVTCGFCRGNGDLSYGKTGEPPADACPICSGKGKLLINAEHFPLVECARCRGTGSTYLLSDSNNGSVQALLDHVCSSCHGAGCQGLVGNWQIVRSPGKVQNKAAIFHLTGLTGDEIEAALANKQDFTCCFVCKRPHEQQSIAFNDQGEALAGPLRMSRYRKQVGEITYTWPICDECARLLDL